MSESGNAAPLKDKRKKDKKRKRDDAVVAPEHSTGFSLLGGNRDAELDDIFGKSSTLATVAGPSSIPQSSSIPSASTAAAGAGNLAPLKTKPTKAKRSKKTETGDANDVLQSGAPNTQASANRAGPSTLPTSTAQSDKEHDEEADSGDPESDLQPSTLVHESLSKRANSKRQEKRAAAHGRYVPPGESAADRDRRTLFLGNLPISVAKSKADLNHLKAHLLTFAPSAKIESVRFRSVAFAAPTAPLPDDDAAEGGDQKRQKREADRAKKWKEAQEALKAGGEQALEVDPTKNYMDAKGKRKVAFIKKEFHEDLKTCNGYVVFAHPHPDRSAKVAAILDPYEAAEKVLAANGSSFQDRTIRVDRLRLPSAQGLQAATTALSKRDAWLPSGTDPRRSLFVGGLDYAAKEEDVRVFFEELVKAERGPREGGGKYVTDVRIIRDKETQMGKGFGYVHFADRESADEVVALPTAKLKFAKKPLRVQTSKTLPASITRPKVATAASSAGGTGLDTKAAKARPSRPVGPIKVPKGDPSLGDKLKSLSKEERKLAKAADADRAARRLAKKQSKTAAKFTETGAVKLGPTKAERKDRQGGAGKAKKSRVRSSNALAQMKGSRN